ncbi:MAG: hypothetical protein GX957_04580 [Clostridiaceae bacterium]|nr:hypothetical protein [Clostridiaceae bacterium]
MESNCPQRSTLLMSIENSLKDKRKLVIILLSAFLALIFILSVIIICSILNSTTIYNGVYIGNKNVGNFTKEELKKYLFDNYSDILNEVNFTITCKHFSRNYNAAVSGLALDVAAMTDKAYSIGRTGNFIERITRILKLKKKPVHIGLIIDDSSKEFQSFLDNITKEVNKEVVPHNIIILEDRVILCTGLPGQTADEDKLRQDIINAVTNLNNNDVEIKFIQKLPPPIDYQATLATLNKDPVNAIFKKISRTTYEITTHEMGRFIDSLKLLEIINYVENRESYEYEEILLPVEFIAPLVTKEELENIVFRDTLAAFTTYFQTNTQNNINRGINIGLAAESIDGTILLPGEEFSFNEVVGPRTPEKGYKSAHIYVQGEIRDGIGGGICQVSTTLYNAVLRANLEVTERHNHMFTVGYVPLGTDAAVSYGYADLKFKNTTGYPLKIEAVVQKNAVGFKLICTNEYPDLKVKLATKTISSTPRTVVYIDDPSLPLGITKIFSNGMDGYVVDTYIRIYNGETLLKEEKIHRSVYNMLPQKIIRGTGPISEIIE